MLWESTVEASPLRTTAGPRKRLHELVCELGGLDRKSNVSAGQLDQVPTEFPSQLHVHLVGRVATRFPPGHRDDPVGVRLEGVQVEVDRRILAQLVLKPVGGVGKDILAFAGSIARAMVRRSDAANACSRNRCSAGSMPAWR
jgi:hypothetical protein